MNTLQPEKMKYYSKDTWVLRGVACSITKHQYCAYSYLITFSIDESMIQSIIYPTYQDALHALNLALSPYNRYVDVKGLQTTMPKGLIRE